MVVRQVVCWLPWRPAVHPEKATNTRQTKTRSSRMAQWSEGHRATVEDQKRNIPGSSWSGTFCSISDGIGRSTFTLDSVFVCSNDQWFLMKWWNNFFSLDVGGMFIERALIGNWSEAVHYMVHTTWVGDISISIWCCCGVCLCWGCPLHSAIADTL